MLQHKQEHINRERNVTWTCDDCKDEPKEVFYTKSNFRQHVRGAHGPGYIARCQKVCKWPSERRKHQMECDNCKRILFEKLSEPKNPWKKTLQKGHTEK